jgi:hypothetical protein
MSQFLLSVSTSSFRASLPQNELLSRLLQLYDLLPAPTSKWRKRRRRQYEEVQPGTGTAGLFRQCPDAALDCSDNSR